MGAVGIEFKMAMLNFTEASKLLDDKYSCFELVTNKQHIALPPKYINKIKTGITEQLSTQVKLYSETLQGVLVAFDNLKRVQKHGKVMGSQPFIHFDVQADFIVFKPTIGCILKGMVNKMSKHHVGCLVHGVFNASIPKTSFRASLEPSVGQTVYFSVEKIYSNGGLIGMRGSVDGVSQNGANKRKAEEIASEDLDEILSSAQTSSLTEEVVKHKKKKHKSSESPSVSQNDLNASEGKHKKKKHKKDKSREKVSEHETSTFSEDKSQSTSESLGLNGTRTNIADNHDSGFSSSETGNVTLGLSFNVPAGSTSTPMTTSSKPRLDELDSSSKKKKKKKKHKSDKE